MAAIDPYSPCPCGSGEKFKWCCHKVEVYVERAQRLVDTGQNESAVKALNEGLAKEPTNAWLLTRKTLVLIRLQRFEEAAEAAEAILKAHPKHASAHALITRLRLETAGAAAGVAQLQRSLAAYSPGERRALAPLVKVVGVFLAEADEFPAAIRHLNLYASLQGKADPAVNSMIRSIEAKTSIAPALKNPYGLLPAPASATAEIRDRFNEALDLSAQGLWSSAAVVFESLLNDRLSGPIAARNLGFCRLWLADMPAASKALRKYVATLGASQEAIDLECLCQRISEPAPDELVDLVLLTWPLRDRTLVLEALKADPSVDESGPSRLDPDDPESEEILVFSLLDKPALETAAADLTVDQIPRIVGRVLVGDEIVSLETFDDGRLDALADRVRGLLDRGIPPAHPKTKELRKVPRFQLAMMWEWLLPPGVTPAQSRRLQADQGRRLMVDLWCDVPNPDLRGMTPRQAARTAGLEVPLRAAILDLELGSTETSSATSADFRDLRERLGVPIEPAIDPEKVNIASLALPRLALVPIKALDDARLADLYRRARRYMFVKVLGESARELISRRCPLRQLGVRSLEVYSDLASLALLNEEYEEAIDWIRKGRAADTPAELLSHAPIWDTSEIKIKARCQEPEQWVPELAVAIERHSGSPQAMEVLLSTLVELGLVQLSPTPDDDGRVVVDSRVLDAVMRKYGPRVTTSTGQLGVSATKPEIWTPATAAGGSGGAGIWTPGSGASAPPSSGAPSGGPSKLVLPGQ